MSTYDIQITRKYYIHFKVKKSQIKYCFEFIYLPTKPR